MVCNISNRPILIACRTPPPEPLPMRFTPFLFLPFALFLAAASASASPPQASPNILLIFADDQRADTIGAWGNPFIDTPNIDQIAKSGMSFRRTYCMGSMHGAVCVPSRAMLHTGRDYHGLDVSNFEGCRTMGEVLGAAGYTTFGTGKWHNGKGTFQRSFQSGNSIMFSGMSNHREVPLTDLAEGEYTKQRTGNAHSSELFANAAIEFLNGYESEDPFFCYLAFSAPHDPRDPPRPYAERYYDRRPPLPRNFLPQHPFDNGMLVLRDENLGAWPRTEELVADQLAEYYGIITHMDEQLGRVLAALEATGKADNTIVIYAADHGLALGSHGLLGKQSLYEHSMRAPLIIAGPGIPEGASSTALTYLFDLYPTLLGLAGTQGDLDIEGRNLANIWKGESEGVRDSIFLSMKNTQRAVTDGRWKLIRYPAIDMTQLFDLASDPDELLNLAGRPEHGKRVAELWKELQRWQAQIGDDLPLHVDEPGEPFVDLTNTPRKPDRWQPLWIRKKYFEEQD
ncbi:MAG: arylsulfatase A-like enzyme [Planctomycetota bacterium]|jgi:arylsulfatase A-like enzyme